MCKVGDIILVDSYKHDEIVIDKHSFVVVFDEAGVVKGLPYDIACTVMSSFHDEAHRQKKMQYPATFPISANDEIITKGTPHKFDGYIKADQLYLFNLSKIKYSVIGCMMPNAFNELIKHIESLDSHVFIDSNL